MFHSVINIRSDIHGFLNNLFLAFLPPKQQKYYIKPRFGEIPCPIRVLRCPFLPRNAMDDPGWSWIKKKPLPDRFMKPLQAKAFNLCKWQ
jgi:hypothetical protein